MLGGKVNRGPDTKKLKSLSRGFKSRALYAHVSIVNFRISIPRTGSCFPSGVYESSKIQTSVLCFGKQFLLSHNLDVLVSSYFRGFPALLGFSIDEYSNCATSSARTTNARHTDGNSPHW